MQFILTSKHFCPQRACNLKNPRKWNEASLSAGEGKQTRIGQRQLRFMQGEHFTATLYLYPSSPPQLPVYSQVIHDCILKVPSVHHSGSCWWRNIQRGEHCGMRSIPYMLERLHKTVTQVCHLQQKASMSWKTCRFAILRSSPIYISENLQLCDIFASFIPIPTRAICTNNFAPTKTTKRLSLGAL